MTSQITVSYSVEKIENSVATVTFTDSATDIIHSKSVNVPMINGKIDDVAWIETLESQKLGIIQKIKVGVIIKNSPTDSDSEEQ